MRVSEIFILEEFVDPDTFQKFGKKSLWFIDPKIINIIQYIRMAIDKPITVNNWHTGGTYQQSGFRPPQSMIGAKMGQHRFGRAADIKCDIPLADLFDFMTKNFKILSSLGLTTIENIEKTPTWLHLDIRQWENNPELHII